MACNKAENVLQHEAADGEDQAVCLGKGDEESGRDHAVLFVLESDQRLRRGEAAKAVVVDWLIVHLKPVLRDRSAQDILHVIDDLVVVGLHDLRGAEEALPLAALKNGKSFG